MLALRGTKNLRARLHTATCQRFLSMQQRQQQQQLSELDSSEYTAEPQYPPIRDLTYKARKEQNAADWHEAIRQTPTVEEKLIKINMPRYYGYKVVDLNDAQSMPYNALPLIQHYTRTILEEEPAPVPVPVTQEASDVDKKFDAFVDTARGDVIEALEFAHDYFRHQESLLATPLDAVTRERQLTQIIVEQLHRVLHQTLSADCTHLNDIEVDYNPRHEAFWAVGGVNPPKNVVKSKEGRDWQKPDAHESVDRLVQYTGMPYLALRHRQQLATWKPFEEYENVEMLLKKLPRYNYDARTLGFTTKHQHAVNVPGYWPSANTANFGLLSYQSRAHLQLRPSSSSYGENDLHEALHSLAIQSSYAWLLAQANYNGFNTYNELTYPMNTQTIITNGHEFSFYEYQLNTLLMHGHHVDDNARVNFCRGTATPIQLYGTMTSAGKCVDLNVEAVKKLLRFYMNAPSDVEQRSASEQQPYVDSQSSLRRIADYTNIEQREFLDGVFKHLMSKRERHLELPEIYMWEKLYKIDNKTRGAEARRRFFELSINPWRRTLDQHDKVYVPRAVRPGGKKNREGRFKKTYYP